MAPDTIPPWWKAPWKFFIETLVGVFIFGVIASAAVAINLVVVVLTLRGVDWYIIWGLKGAEYALFTTDLVLFGRFLWRTASRTWKEL
jgi:hypothetical protein